MSKAYPCGAGLGLMGVSPPTATSRSATASPGRTRTSSARCADGIDRAAQHAFLEKHHIANKTDCSTCWARPLCSGGCYHEAHTRYGDTTHAEPALLRLDPRLDRRLPADLRRDCPNAIRRSSRSSTMTKRRSACLGAEEIMKHLKAINQKAVASAVVRSRGRDGADRETTSSRCSGPASRSSPAAHFPLGCSLVFSPGWEADRTGGTAGLCQPVERDLFDCHIGCYWPAQVPDQLNHAPDWTSKCAAAQKDWRKIDLIFP